jgi:uncharacterized protein (DUF608 family)
MKFMVLLSNFDLIKRKILALGIVLLFFGVTINPVFGSSPKTLVLENTKIDEKSLNSSGFFETKMTIPEYCYNLSKAPSEYEVEDYLKKEEFNFPIGNFGNNYISYGPHGIDRIALYNNYFDAFGGSQGTGGDNPRCLNGTFLGVYMNNGKQRVCRLLQQYSPTTRGAFDYRIQPIEKMECFSNIPVGYYKYQDPSFSAEIGLIVYSPIILYDTKNSSIPVSTWVFNAYNPTDDPVEVSFLFSLENDIGWRYKQEIKTNNNEEPKTSYRYIWQRNGTYNYIHETDNMIGIVSTYDENIMSKSRPEYLGDMTLATIKQPNVTISYTSEWDTLGDGRDLTDSFCNNGTLNNKNISNRAIENEHIYAGALSAKIILEPGEGKNIPFVLSTFFPVFNLSNITGMSANEFYKWAWTKYFDNSLSIAKYSFDNYENWWKKINDWQKTLYSSGLPPETMTYMMGSLAVFVSSVFFSEEGYWFTANSGLGYLESLSPSLETDWFMCMFFPEIMDNRIEKSCIDLDKDNDGYIWDGQLDLHQFTSFVIRLYRAWIWNHGDEKFLRMIYENCSKAQKFGMSQKTYDKEEGLIHNRGNDQIMDWWITPTSAHLNSMWLLSLKCMINMAEKLQYYEDAEFYKEELKKAQQSFIERFWLENNNQGYFKLCDKKIGLYGWWYYPGEYRKPEVPYPFPITDTNACMIAQILGIWFGRLFNEDILPLEKTNESLSTIYDINYDYCNNLGWITSVYGKHPHFIDRFAICINDMPNSVQKKSQWTFATTLLSHGFIEEGIKVANLTTENYLYKRGGGIYVTHSHNKNTAYGVGTNKINYIKTWRTLKSRILIWLITRGVWGDKEWKVQDGYYPPKYPRDLPSWSLYQAASGFTPCVDGLKIKPRVGGDNISYITQFSRCKIKMNVTGTGGSIKSTKINGEPYDNIIDGNVFIPLEMFRNQDKMYVDISLSK